MKGFGLRVRRRAGELGIPDAEIARRVGISARRYSNYATEEREPDLTTLCQIARALEVSPNWLLGWDGNGEDQRREKRPALMTIPEVDVRAGMGSGGEALIAYETTRDGDRTSADDLRGQWLMPETYLAQEIGVQPRFAAVIEAIGDSMEPVLHAGDRLMINLEDRNPSPAGIFALWDGFGVVVKRIERVPNSDPPRLSVTSANQAYRPYEVVADEARIIGRVVWFARRM